MTSTNLHAYMKDNCFCPLDKHLVNTVVSINETRLSRRLASIALRLGGPDKKDTYYNYLLLPFILHDIGKALEIYQKNILGYSYIYHEVFGAILSYRIIERSFLKMVEKEYIEPQDFKKLIVLVIYPILYHHYSMRSPKDPEVIERDLFGKKRYLFIETSTLEKLLYTLYNEVSKHGVVRYARIRRWMLPDILKDLTSEAKELGSRIELADVKRYLNEMYENTLGALKSSEKDLIEIYLSILTGLVNTADYLVASIERRVCEEGPRSGGKHGFVDYILSSEEISALEYRLVGESSICIQR